MQVKSMPNPVAPGSTHTQTFQTGSGIKPEVRAKVIEMIQKGNPAPQAQEHPVKNPNQISPEEISAINPPTQEVAENTVSSVEAPESQPETTPTQEDPTVTKKFAQLARQERLFRQKAQQQAQALKAKEAELTAKEAAIKAKETEYNQGYISKDQLRKETLRILAEAGVSYDDLTQQILNHAPPDPRMEATVNTLRAEIDNLKAELKKSSDTATQRDQDTRRAAERQILMDAQQLVKSNPIAYEAINRIGERGVREIQRLITRTYDRDGYVMSVDEAADAVENYLVDENFNMANSVSKIKRRLTQAGQPEVNKKTSQSQQTQQPGQTGMKTLTNQASSSRKLSSRERAMLAFKGEPVR